MAYDFTSAGDGDWDADATWNEAGNPTDDPAATVLISAGHTVTVTADDTHTGTITAQGDLAIEGDVTLTADHIVLDDVTGEDWGWLYPGDPNAVVDGLVTVTANGGTIDWCGGCLSINGSIDAGGNTFTHMGVGTAGELTLSGTHDFDTGTTDPTAAPAVDTDATASATLTADVCAVYGFDFAGGGTLKGGPDADHPKTVLLGAGGLDYTTGGINGKGRVKFVVTETPASFTYDYSGAPSFQIDAATTATGDVHATSLLTNAVLDMGGNELIFWPMTDNWLTTTGSGQITNAHWGNVYVSFIVTPADLSNAGFADLGNNRLKFANTNGHTFKFAGGISCSTLWLYADLDGGTIDMDGGDLTVSDDIWFDTDGATLMLGEGSHTVGGDIKRDDGDETGNEMHLESCLLNLGGTLDGDGITITNESALVFGGTIQNVNAGETKELWAYHATGKQRGVDDRAPTFPDNSLNTSLDVGNTNVVSARVVRQGGTMRNWTGRSSSGRAI